MKNMFYVTYEIVTPESVEQGDAEERGYYHPGGGRDALESVDNVTDYAMDLRTALRHCDPAYDSGRWFDSHPYTEDFQTGAELSTSLHPPRNITPASYARLKRLVSANH